MREAVGLVDEQLLGPREHAVRAEDRLQLGEQGHCASPRSRTVNCQRMVSA
ncbi:MAG: hypothetical protein ACHQ6V_19960 [Myxococcota bacterium]